MTQNSSCLAVTFFSARQELETRAGTTQEAAAETCRASPCTTSAPVRSIPTSATASASSEPPKKLNPVAAWIQPWLITHTDWWISNYKNLTGTVILILFPWHTISRFRFSWLERNFNYVSATAGLKTIPWQVDISFKFAFFFSCGVVRVLASRKNSNWKQVPPACLTQTRSHLAMQKVLLSPVFGWPTTTGN